MAAKVLAIWLDGAEPLLLERMMGDGEMPHLRRLCARGSHGRLTSLEHSLSETAYGMLLTGQPPAKTGTWNVGEFDPKTYREGEMEPTHYCGLPFFLQLDPTLRTCIFDIPGLPMLPNLNGIQVASWGAHSPKVGPGSQPAELLAELTARYGVHPCEDNHDFACLDDPLAMRDLQERILTGIPRRGEIIRDLLARDDWDLLFASFGEPSFGHTRTAFHCLRQAERSMRCRAFIVRLMRSWAKSQPRPEVTRV
jgi:predicted AlkP superfamily phosphohydrolase/phosphomutase